MQQTRQHRKPSQMHQLIPRWRNQPGCLWLVTAPDEQRQQCQGWNQSKPAKQSEYRGKRTWIDDAAPMMLETADRPVGANLFA
jgi:hypothetical protein